jgi:hypothetical protein
MLERTLWLIVCAIAAAEGQLANLRESLHGLLDEIRRRA